MLISSYLFDAGYYKTIEESIRYGVFQSVSMVTTTGFVSTDFSLWPFVLPVFLIFVSFIGACAGSTGGGIKVVRILLMFKLAMQEIKNLYTLMHKLILNLIKKCF